MPASDNDQPRDEHGRWVAEGGSHRKELQNKHAKLLDRLKKEDANRPAYGADGWEMGKGGYDTRGQAELDRPLVLGEIPHPQDKDTHVPVVLREGEQDTTELGGTGAGHGRRHIEYRHGQEIRNQGFRHALDFVSHLVDKHDIDADDKRHESRVLAQRPAEERSNAKTPFTALRLHENADHYSVSTAYRGKWRDIKKLEQQAGSSPHSPSAQDDQSNKVLPHNLQGSLHCGTGENSPAVPPILHDAPTSFQAKPLYPPSYFQSLHKSKPLDTPDNVRAAGLVYAANGRVLLLKRPDGSWGMIAGSCEDGETARQTAIRESIEEVGCAPEGKTLWSVQMPRSDGPGDIRAYAVALEQDFTPTLNDEHTGWGWFEGDKLPSPLFPGTADVLDRFTIDMGTMCRKIADGTYTSPQRFMNVTLFAMRISGTGWAYRDGERRQYAYRSRDDWLTPEVMEACQGLPVVLEHPNSAVVTDDFYRERTVGSVIYPFIKGDELWAVVRIQDQNVATLLSDMPWSTSPGVISAKNSISRPLGEDGTTLLLEGAPYHPDHLAIVPAGVWDKGGPPSGIDAPSTRQHGDNSPMADLKDALTTAHNALSDRCASAQKDADTNGDTDKSAFYAQLLEQLDKLKGLIEGGFSSQQDSAEEDPGHEQTIAEDLKKIAQDAAEYGEKKEASMPSQHIPGEPLSEQDTQASSETPQNREELADELSRIARDCIEQTAPRHEPERRDGAPAAEKDKSQKDATEGPSDMLRRMVEALRKSGADEEAIAQCVEECGGDPKDYLSADNDDTRRIREQLAEMDRRDKERRDELEEVKSRTKPLSDEEHNEISELQSHTDAVAQPLGVQTPRYVPGETVAGYKRRCAELLKPHSKEWSQTNLATLSPEVFEIASRQIHKDAQEAASRPAAYADSAPLRAVRQRHESGHSRTDYRGSFRSGFGAFMA